MISLVPEGLGSYEHQLPIGRLGDSTYCIVVIDQNGIFDTNIPASSCSTVYEDAFYNWVAEPTQVTAEFTGTQLRLYNGKISWERKGKFTIFGVLII
jgi:hypothetical protein